MVFRCPAEESGEEDGVHVPAHDFAVADDNDGWMHVAGDEPLRVFEVCQVLGTSLGVGQDEGNRGRAPAGGADALTGVGLGGG